MSVKITQPIPPNVVEIGNEITQGVVDGLMSANPSASSANPYVTQSLLSNKLSLTGGTMTGSILINATGNNDGTPYTYGTTYSATGVVAVNNNGDWTNGFSLTENGINGTQGTGADTWGLNRDGVSGHDDSIPSNWGIGTSGVLFPDNTIQTTAATAPDLTPYLTKADNLASLTSFSTARTNLGLGAVATDAYATTAQAQAGTSTTTVINPSTLLDAKYFAGYKSLSMIYTWTSATSGTGASTTVSGQAKNVFAPTSAIGYAQAYVFNYNATRGSASAIGADFSKRTTIGGRFIKTVTTADANSIFRFILGKFIPTPSAGDLSARGIGFRQVANGALELQVHNGTTLYNVTSSFTPTANQSYDLTIVSDGAGNATMYVNGSSVATSANAPTAILTTNSGILEVEVQNTAILSGSAMSYSCSDMFVQTNI